MNILQALFCLGSAAVSFGETNTSETTASPLPPIPCADQECERLKEHLDTAHTDLLELLGYNGNLAEYPITFITRYVLEIFKFHAEHLFAVSKVASLARTLHDPFLSAAERQANVNKYAPYFASLQPLHSLELNLELMLTMYTGKIFHKLRKGKTRDKLESIADGYKGWTEAIHASMPAQYKEVKVGPDENLTTYYEPIESHFNTVKMFSDYTSYSMLRDYVCDNAYESGVYVIKTLMYPTLDDKSLMELYAENLDVKFNESLDYSLTVVATLSRMMYKIALCNGVHQMDPDTSSKQLFYLGSMTADVILGMFQIMFETFEKYEVKLFCNRTEGINYVKPDPKKKLDLDGAVSNHYPLSAYKFDDDSPNKGKDCVMHYQYGLGKLGVLSLDPTLYGNEKNKNKVPKYINTTEFHVYIEREHGEPITLFSFNNSTDALSNDELWRLLYTGSTRMIRELPMGTLNITLSHKDNAFAYKSMVLHGELPVKVEIKQMRQQNKKWTAQARCNHINDKYDKKHSSESAFLTELNETEMAIVEIISNGSSVYLPGFLCPRGLQCENEFKNRKSEYAKKLFEGLSPNNKTKKINEITKFWNRLNNCQYATDNYTRNATKMWNTAVEFNYLNNTIHRKNPVDEINDTICTTELDKNYTMTPNYVVIDDIAVLMGVDGLFRAQFEEKALAGTYFCGKSESVTLSFIIGAAFVVRSNLIDPVSYITIELDKNYTMTPNYVVIDDIAVLMGVDGLFRAQFEEKALETYTKGAAMAKYAKQLSQANKVLHKFRAAHQTKKEQNNLGMYVGIGVGSFAGAVVLVGVVVGAAYLHRRNKLPNIKTMRREKPDTVVEGDSKRSDDYEDIASMHTSQLSKGTKVEKGKKQKEKDEPSKKQIEHKSAEISSKNHSEKATKWFPKEKAPKQTSDRAVSFSEVGNKLPKTPSKSAKSTVPQTDRLVPAKVAPHSGTVSLSEKSKKHSFGKKQPTKREFPKKAARAAKGNVKQGTNNVKNNMVNVAKANK